MAETFLSPVIQKLVDLLAQQVNLLKGVHREVKNLKDELEIIQPFLKDAEEKLSRGDVSNATKVWLKQMKEVANRIGDVVDEYLYHLAKHHCHERGGLVGFLRKASVYVRSLKPRQDISSEIRDINKSLQKIKERGISYGLRPSEQGSSITATNVGPSFVDPRLGSLFIEEDEFVGIDSTAKEVIRSLVEGKSIRSVISIVGEGGIGKSTLAKKVYKDEAVRQHFECFARINVSQSYNVEKFLENMKKQMCHAKEESVGTIEELIEFLRHYLETKRCVVVFDDVWKIEYWEVINHVLPSKNKRARIIITTRNTSIANTVKDTPFDLVQELKSWSPELAWELFCKKTFRFEFGGCCPQELEQLSRKIVSKCQGLPLVIAAIAGLLSKKEKTILEWQRVLDNLNNEFENNPQLTSVSKILSFSYYDLPYHLKSCFLYFGIFPEDYPILDRRLYRLWSSEGFIVKSGADKPLEQVAEEYLTELIYRNLVSFEIACGVERWCRVHDLIHDIISTKIEELCFCQIINESKLRSKGKSCRLSIHSTTNNVLNLVGDNSKIRSIFLFNIEHQLTESFIISLFEQFKLLTVLDFEDAPLDKIPKKIGNLFNLKYLNLAYTTVKIVPKSIGKLLNLQSLNLFNTLVLELPIEIKKLQKLRHLEVKLSISLETEFNMDLDHGVRIHEGIGCLEELQTIACVRAYPSRVDLVKELESLKKLKILGIKQLTAEIGKALGASIEKTNQLEELYLYAINESEILDLKCISSPPSIRCLELGCRLQHLPDWISKLQKLQSLSLKYTRLMDEPLKCLKDLPILTYLEFYQTYDGEELHFEEGGFQKLKQLQLVNSEGLKVLKIDRGALPLLEKLTFGFFPLMKEIPSDIQHLSNLKSLEIANMPREFVVGLQPNCSHYWKIQHVLSVNFWYKSKGDIYDIYKLGESDLMELLQEQANRSMGVEMQ